MAASLAVAPDGKAPLKTPCCCSAKSAFSFSFVAAIFRSSSDEFALSSTGCSRISLIICRKRAIAASLWATSAGNWPLKNPCG